MIDRILDIAFTGFWHFVGITILLYTPFHIICHYGTAIITRFYRVIKVTVRGWPPSHLDADGDFHTPNKKEDEKD